MSTQESTRLYFLDNLKSALTVMVVAQHAAVPYTPGVWWQVDSHHHTHWLGPFMTINTAYIMPLFFLISAYFHPAALERKGPARFMGGRLRRLGIPLCAFFLGVIPVILYAYYVNFRNHGPLPFWDYYVNVYFGAEPRPDGWTGPAWPDMQLMHLWFLEHLLLGAALYTLWRSLTARSAGVLRTSPVRETKLGAKTSHAALLGYLFALAFASFLIRPRFPLGMSIAFLGFIQVEPAHVPQYVSCFVIGLAAYRRNWLLRFPASVGRVWLVLGLVAVGLRYSPLLTGLDGRLAGGSLSWQGAFYALWEAGACVGLSVGLLVLFRERVNGRGRLARFLAVNAYTVYLIHMPIVTVLQYGVEPLNLPAWALASLVAVFGVPLSFILSHYVVRRFPYAQTIL